MKYEPLNSHHIFKDKKYKLSLKQSTIKNRDKMWQI